MLNNQKVKLDKNNILQYIINILEILDSIDDWTKSNLELIIRSYCQQNNINLRDMSYAIRICTTGKPTGVGIFDVLDILGKTSVINRIKRAVSQAQTNSSPKE